MDKGKRPLIEDEEEDFFSVLNGLHEEMISGNPSRTTNNFLLKPWLIIIKKLKI